jgi:hypothetical protein
MVQDKFTSVMSPNVNIFQKGKKLMIARVNLAALSPEFAAV